MNVFVLCTGRCGSTTFIKASGHITNFTSGHESRHAFIGNSRLAYAPAHIEADNRLTWLLGRLDRFFGKDAYYVHLQRDILETAESYAERWDTEVGIMKAYRCGILMRREPAVVPSARDKLAMALDYCMTVNENILYFLKDKPNQMDFRLENAANDWERFWKWIGARGDFAASLGEWNIKHNARKTAPVA